MSKKNIDDLRQDLVDQLAKVSGLTEKEAKKELLQQLEHKLQKEVAQRLKQAEESIKLQANEKAKEILVDTMFHGATDYVAEYTISVIRLKDQDIKSKIIGREGRNLRAFERATGVDRDLDEAPDQVRLSCFDSVRREIARVALEKLIKDGRIQPTRIEEVVKQVKADINKIIQKEGEDLCYRVGAFNIPIDIIKLLGRFKYRFSYGQNMIKHTIEETQMGVKLASELGADVDTVRLGCLLHDLGKTIPEPGSHVQLGVELAKKHQFPQPVIDCIAQHHEDEPFTSLEAIVVYIVDALSGARPGARRDDYNEYINRLQKLETIAKNFPGVVEAYAIQAGREVRVIVSPEKLSDEETTILASKIKDQVESELTYPGTVTVNVIRELRATAVAQ